STASTTPSTAPSPRRWPRPTSRSCRDRCGWAWATSSTTSASRSARSTRCCRAGRSRPDSRWGGSCSTPPSASAGCSTRPPRPTSPTAARTSARRSACGAGRTRATSNCPCSGRAPCATPSAWWGTRRCRRRARSRTTAPASSCRACNWWTCAPSCSPSMRCAKARPTSTRWFAMPGCSAATTRSSQTAAASKPTNCRTTCSTTKPIPRSRSTSCRSCRSRPRPEPGPRRPLGVVARRRLRRVLSLGIGIRAEQRLRLLRRQRLHAAQAALDGAGLAAGLAQAAPDRADLLLGLLENTGELAELALHRTQQLPHFARTLLDGQGAEPHLQAVEQCGDRGRPGGDDAVFALQRVHRAWPADGLGVPCLGAQEPHRYLRVRRRPCVLVAARPGLQPDLPPGLHAGPAHRLHISRLLGIEQALGVLARELGVDRQPRR